MRSQYSQMASASRLLFCRGLGEQRDVALGEEAVKPFVAVDVFVHNERLGRWSAEGLLEAFLW